ncbi:hypothetical protein ACFQ4O_01715 [Methylopila musalis]|uniref:Glycoside hydrolase family 19 catalytic domain-containing protein n=1 Tax=Methylopila musalis TaxID=1134781 RepID=A0ABW3Z3E3_9HYPH
MDAAAFFAAVRAEPFGGTLPQKAVDGLTAILKGWSLFGDGDLRKLAYILATAFHEADRFRTMEEYASGAAYEGRKDLGNTQAGDGKRFKGRGFVQITGRRNYADWSERTGYDLVRLPEMAAEPALAARILVQGSILGTFTGKKLGDYIAAAKADYTNARRVINGTDKAALIAGYATKFEAALKAAGYGVKPVTADAEPAPVPDDRAARLAEFDAAFAAANEAFVNLRLARERL